MRRQGLARCARRYAGFALAEPDRLLERLGEQGLSGVTGVDAAPARPGVQQVQQPGVAGAAARVRRGPPELAVAVGDPRVVAPGPEVLRVIDALHEAVHERG